MRVVEAEVSVMNYSTGHNSLAMKLTRRRRKAGSSRAIESLSSGGRRGIRRRETTMVTPWTIHAHPSVPCGADSWTGRERGVWKTKEEDR